MKKLLFVLLTVGLLFAQDQTKSGRPTSVGTATLPTSATVATGLNIYVDYIVLSNHSSSTVTVTMIDQSTNCNAGSACTMLSAIPISGNTLYTIPMYGWYNQGGIKWSASAANSVDCWIAGRY